MSVSAPIPVVRRDDQHDNEQDSYYAYDRHHHDESAPLLSSTSITSPFFDDYYNRQLQQQEQKQAEQQSIKRRLMAAGCVTLVLMALLVCVWAAPPSTTETQLYPWLNNRGCGTGGDFDQMGTSFALNGTYNADYTTVSIPGSTLAFQTHIGQAKDNVIAQGQTIPLLFSKIQAGGALYLLASSSHGPGLDAELVVHYQDSTTSVSRMDVPDWQVDHLDQVLDRTLGVPWRVSNGNIGALFAIPIFIDPSKAIRAIQLPNDDRIHIFAVQALDPGVHAVSARPAQLWDDQGRQIVRVRVHNASPETVKNVRVSIKNGGGEVSMSKLAPGHIAVINVGAPAGKNDITVHITRSKEDASFVLQLGLAHYEPTQSSLQQHQAPQWLEDAKFGIFIHWGLYSVPAWAPVGKEYSEWYWWQMNHEPTYSYHRETYGEDFNYDDFIPKLPNTPDPTKWLDLISRSRARYFVFTTKHHDGLALWNTSVSERSSVHLGPKRDFVDAIMTAAKQPEYAHVKRGLYFSLPEWFHPEYRDVSLGWHGPPKNPYTGKMIPYTGYNPTIRDFVNDHQVPQALELIEYHEPDIFWCDIGGINNSSAWQAPYFNRAASQKRQVAINDRCGNGISDFTTVEYQSNADAPSRFWEATRGIDPYSFGYNQATRQDQYADTGSLLRELIDVVAKGGNLLLNIGPDMYGQVVESMASKLAEMGEWIDHVGPECLFNTTRYWVAPNGVEQNKVRLRFTVAEDGTFYMFILDEPPQGEFTIPVPVPKIESSVTTGKSIHVPWQLDLQNRVVLQISEQVIQASKYVWVFKML